MTIPQRPSDTRARAAGPSNSKGKAQLAREKTEDRAHPSITPMPRRALKMAEVIALDIVRDIVDQGLQPGDRLPLESEMATQYRTSRSTLREAVRLLEVQGLIAIRPGPGSGTVVSEAAPHNLGRTMTLYFHMSNVNYDELLSAWTHTEPVLAELAAANPDADLRRRMLEPFVLPGDKEQAGQKIASGLAFHDVVAELANNRALAMIYRAVGFIISDHMLAYKDRNELERFIVDEHNDVASAIIDGDGVRARELMVAHVRHVVDDFKAYWPRKVGERVRWR